MRALVPPPWRQRRRGRGRVESERELGRSSIIIVDVGKGCWNVEGCDCGIRGK